MYCDQCGARNREGARFCHACGQTLLSPGDAEAPVRESRPAAARPPGDTPAPATRVPGKEDTAPTVPPVYDEPAPTTGRSTAFPLEPPVRVLADLLLILLGFWLAYILRYRYEVGGAVARENDQPFARFLPVMLLLAVILLAVFAARNLYHPPHRASFRDEALEVGGGVIVGFGALLAAALFYRPLSPSRLLLLYALVLVMALLLAERLVWNWLRARARPDTKFGTSVTLLVLLAVVMASAALVFSLGPAGGRGFDRYRPEDVLKEFDRRNLNVGETQTETLGLFNPDQQPPVEATNALTGEMGFVNGRYIVMVYTFKSREGQAAAYAHVNRHFGDQRFNRRITVHANVILFILGAREDTARQYENVLLSLPQ